MTRESGEKSLTSDNYQLSDARNRGFRVISRNDAPARTEKRAGLRAIGCGSRVDYRIWKAIAADNWACYGEVAARVGVPVERVYRAVETLKADAEYERRRELA